MREFITAANDTVAQDDDDKIVEFTLDGTVCRAYPPKDGQVAVLMATGGKHASNNEQVAGFLNFFVGVLDDETHTYVVNRLLDRRDPFGLEQVQSIVEHLMECWSGRPTNSSAGSTTSRRPTGQSSTERTLAST